MAHHLALNGADVTVVDAGEPGSGCSAGNAGWICPILAAPIAAPGILREALRFSLRPTSSPLSLSPSLRPGFLRWSRRFLASASQDRFDHGLSAMVALNQECQGAFDRLRAAGVEFDEQRSGLFAGVRSPQMVETLAASFGAVQAAGYAGRMECFDEAALRIEEPAFSDAVRGGIRFPDERHVLPSSLTAGLLHKIRARGGVIETGARVDRIVRSGNAWLTRTTDGGLESDAVIVAAGTATPGLLRPHGARVLIEPARGYSITMPGRGILPRGALFMPEVKVGCSPFDDMIRFVGTFELGSRSTAISAKRIERVKRHWATFLRDWTPTGESEEWAGLRPMTPDGLPVVGEVPGSRGLFVAAGHGMLGVSLAPVTAELLTSAVLEGVVRPALGPLAVSRF